MSESVVMQGVHPDVLRAIALRGLSASDARMEALVGFRVRFVKLAGRGTVHRDHEFRIVGVQKDYAGRLCYRVVCDAIGDTFGYCAAPDELAFVS